MLISISLRSWCSLNSKWSFLLLNCKYFICLLPVWTTLPFIRSYYRVFVFNVYSSVCSFLGSSGHFGATEASKLLSFYFYNFVLGFLLLHYFLFGCIRSSYRIETFRFSFLFSHIFLNLQGFVFLLQLFSQSIGFLLLKLLLLLFLLFVCNYYGFFPLVCSISPSIIQLAANDVKSYFSYF